MQKRYTNNCILAFGDTHGPYQHKQTLKFLAAVKSSFPIDRVVHMGDLLDMYSVSDYPKDLNHPDTWKDEFKKGRQFVKALGELFPKMELLSSNHDDRAYKKSRVAGVPRELLVPYLKAVNAPEGWKLHKQLSLTVDYDRSQWLFSHTFNMSPIDAAKALNKSICVGHNHTKFGMTAFHNGDKLVWGVDCGCLISDEGHPYKYNKLQISRPILGCTIIQNGEPRLISL